MAAILWKGMAQLCEGIGQIVILPCKACGIACERMGDILTSPFFPYLAITFILNVPCAVMGVNGAQDSSGCDSRWSRWFWVNAVLAIGHCIACIYIVQRIREDQHSTGVIDTGGDTTTTISVQDGVKDADRKIESGTYYASTALPVGDRQNSIAVLPDNVDEVTRHSSFARMKQVLCYDVGVAIYIVAIVVWCIWQTMGVSQVFGGACDGAKSKLVYSLLCAFLYMSLAGTGFACSLCCLR